MSLSGRIGTSTAKIYKYDAFNRLVQFNEGATEATYTYSADNLRNSKTVNGTRIDFVWNGQNLASETKNDITTAYTYDPTGIVMSNNGTDTVRFIKDPHGNVVATSKNDKIVDSYDYTAFGVQLNSAETSNLFRYCGEYYDEELDSVYLRNRYYQPANGRFINEDPVNDGLNWYNYCAGNPVMMMGKTSYWDDLGAPWAVYILADGSELSLAMYSYDIETRKNSKNPGVILNVDGTNIKITFDSEGMINIYKLSNMQILELQYL